ncbi:MAG: PQQ-dependent sugar dehydrogenase [Chloroflexi bacterium]|nr:PQQ-dependent sugar dehydrogenase [Chloroflexota bacterium]
MNNNPARTRLLPATLGLFLSLVVVACIPRVVTPPVSSPPPTTSPSPDAPTVTLTLEPSPTSTDSPYRSDFPDPALYNWSPVVTGLEQPVDIQNAGDGSGRLFVVEKPGRIRIIANWLTLPDPFLDIRDRVGDAGLEQGLLGLAFHPDYAQNGYFYVNYTDVNGDTVIARFQASPDDPNRADPQSELILLQVDQPYANHNGGGLAFGPDGYLYIGLGDGGSAGDPAGNAQNSDTYLGKMLRLDVDTPNAAPEIWASGLRNPWRFSFDSLTGDLYIADVGQNMWEEINFILAGTPGGLNFGWDLFEGMHPFDGQPPAGQVFTSPVAEYSHTEGCSITGGYVYRGAELPEWQRVYFYSDYCTGNVSGMIRADAETWRSTSLFQTGVSVSTFGMDETGEIYFADFGSGMILRLTRR